MTLSMAVDSKNGMSPALWHLVSLSHAQYLHVSTCWSSLCTLLVGVPLGIQQVTSSTAPHTYELSQSLHRILYTTLLRAFCGTRALGPTSNWRSVWCG